MTPLLFAFAVVVVAFTVVVVAVLGGAVAATDVDGAELVADCDEPDEPPQPTTARTVARPKAPIHI